MFTFVSRPLSWIFMQNQVSSTEQSATCQLAALLCVLCGEVAAFSFIKNSQEKNSQEENNEIDVFPQTDRSRWKSAECNLWGIGLWDAGL
jgi:hypothetical protein